MIDIRLKAVPLQGGVTLIALIASTVDLRVRLLM
jgi:hypothetical protein